jgi:hypothetical protein
MNCSRQPKPYRNAFRFVVCPTVARNADAVDVLRDNVEWPPICRRTTLAAVSPTRKLLGSSERLTTQLMDNWSSNEKETPE